MVWEWNRLLLQVGKQSVNIAVVLLQHSHEVGLLRGGQPDAVHIHVKDLVAAAAPQRAIGTSSRVPMPIMRLTMSAVPVLPPSMREFAKRFEEHY